jgi:TonB family protein
MDNKELKRRTGKYIKSIKRSIRTRLGGMKHAVGFAFAVNGEISSVQIYARGELFRRLFPKLLRAAAVEALSEHEKGKRYRGLRGEAVRRFMSRARKGKRETLRLSDRVRIHISATQKSVAYHTYDVVVEGVLHESYLAAGEDGVGRLGHRLDLGSQRNSGIGGLIGNQVGGAYGVGGLVGNQIGEAYGIGGPGSVGTGRGVGSLRGRRVRAPRVMAGRAEVRGAMDKGIIRRIIRRHINEVKYCYQKELQANPLLQGRLVIRFTIAATGQVEVSRVRSSTLGNAEVEQCIAMAVRRWLFPKPKDRGAVVVTYPFVLKVSGGP